MEQKMITIPFNVELAKQIQNGEHPGKIVTRCGLNARIVCWDAKRKHYAIVILVTDSGGEEEVHSCTKDGSVYYYGEPSNYDLFLQVPEWTQYKDGDILSCEVDNGGGDYCKWLSVLRDKVELITSNIGYSSYATYDYDAPMYAGRLSYDDYPDNIDTIRLATDEEKQMFIKRLKEENTDKAKEVLKQFFGIEEVEEKPKCEFEPFQKVLVRQRDFEKWECSLFSNYNKHDDEFPFVCVSGIFNQCIPYNENTKHLLGTTDNWEEE